MTSEAEMKKPIEASSSHRAQRNAHMLKLFIVVCAALVIQSLMHDFLFYSTIPHLKFIEQNRSNSLDIVFKIVSEFSDKYAYVVIIGATYHWFDNANAFLVTAVIYTALGVLSVVKSFLHEARPFFVSEITPTKCWLEYGNPSGHSITSLSLYLTVWDLASKEFKASPCKRRILLAFTLLICFLIAFSRIYHGVHTYNQILMGWTLGFSLYYFFCHVVYADIIRFCSQTHTYSWTKLLLNKGTCVFYSIYAMAIFNFLFGNMIHPMPKEWSE